MKLLTERQQLYLIHTHNYLHDFFEREICDIIAQGLIFDLRQVMKLR